MMYQEYFVCSTPAVVLVLTSIGPEYHKFIDQVQISPRAHVTMVTW